MREFHAEYTAGPPTISVKLRASLTGVCERRRIADFSDSAKVAADSDTMHGVVSAFDRAMADVAAMLLDEVLEATADAEAVAVNSGC